MSWIKDREKFELINLIKETDIFRSLYKLLILVYLGVNKTTHIKLILGGNYYNIISQAEQRGYIKRESGGILTLTEYGEQLASNLYQCIVLLREKKERTSEA